MPRENSPNGGHECVFRRKLRHLFLPPFGYVAQRAVTVMIMKVMHEALLMMV